MKTLFHNLFLSGLLSLAVSCLQSALHADEYFTGKVGINEIAPSSILDVKGDALFKSNADASSLLDYTYGQRAYRYVFERDGYNTLFRSYNWHSIVSFDRTNGSPLGPSAVSDGETLFELWASGYSPNGHNVAKSVFRSIVDGAPSGDTVNQELRLFSDKLNVRSTGHVGINKTKPGAPLDLWASTQSRYARFNGNNGIYDFKSTGLFFTSTITNGGPHLYLQDADNHDGRFLIEALGAGGSINAFMVTSSGKVGIGTRTPANELEVNGAIRAKEVIVETAGWPDYVFAEDYALPSLDEVAAHIAEKKHLPGVPSSAEVNSSGQSLGQTQRLMMQKIEELTLYVIEQETRLNQKDRQLAKLNEKVASLERALKQ